MKIFRLDDLYNRSTGKKEGTIWREDKLACDYCAEVIDPEEICGGILEYKVFDLTDIEPTYDLDRIEYNTAIIDIYELFRVHNTFVYCDPWESIGFSCETKLINYAYHNKCDTLCSAMYECRYAVVKKLLETYSTEQLQLQYR